MIQHNGLKIDEIPSEVIEELKEVYKVLNFDNYGIITEDVRSQRLNFQKLLEKNAYSTATVIDPVTYRAVSKYYENASVYQTYIVRGVRKEDCFEVRSVIESGTIIEETGNV